MSPFLKGNVPTSSLMAEAISQPATQASKAENDRLTSAGWKIQSLNSAADTVLAAAKKLEREMTLETRYWNQVNSIREHDWSICRLPREKQILGLRFGFLEAPTEFRDKGLAPLRRREDGSVDLDLNINKGRPKELRSRVLQGGNTIAVSLRNTEKTGDDSIGTDVLKARNSIFDSELFSEIHKEARNLASRGIRCRDNAVTVPLEDDMVVIIELVDQANSIPVVSPKSDLGQYQKLPRFVLVALRLLLCHSHRQNYRKRREKPPAISDRRTQRPSVSLLRPILDYLQQKSAIENLRRGLGQMQKVLSNAQLDLQIGPIEEKLDLRKLSQPSRSQGNADYVHQLVDMLCNALQFTVEVEAPAQNSSITIQVRTYAFGTQYKLFRSQNVVTNPETDLILPEDVVYTDQSDVLELLAEALKVDLVKWIESESGGKWHAETPFWGELQSTPRNGDYHKFRINLKPDSMELLWGIVRFLQDVDAEIVKTWKASDSIEDSKLGLLQAIESMSSAHMDNDLVPYEMQVLGQQMQ